MVERKNIGIYIFTVLWIFILFTGSRMVGRYYCNSIIWGMNIVLIFLNTKQGSMISKLQFSMLPVLATMILSGIWGISESASNYYLPILLFGFLIYSREENIVSMDFMFKFIEIFSVLVALSILLELVDGQFVYKYFWFFFEYNKGASWYLIDLKNGEHIIGAYSGIIGEKADAAFVLVVGLTYVWNCILIKCEISNKSRIRYYVEALLLYIALFLTGKRTLFVCAFFIIGIILFVYGKMFPKKISNKILGVFLILAVIFVVSQFFEETATMFERLSMSQNNDAAFQEREVYWNICMEMFETSPIVGHGFGSFPEYCRRYHFEVPSFAHNIYYEWLGELGCVGVIVALCWIFSLLGACSSINRRLLDCDVDKILQYSFSLSMVLTILLYGFTGNCIYYSNQLLWLLFCSKSIFEMNYRSLEVEIG